MPQIDAIHRSMNERSRNRHVHEYGRYRVSLTEFCLGVGPVCFVLPPSRCACGVDADVVVALRWLAESGSTASGDVGGLR